MAGTLLLERCNPYGAETGGPRRVMGGLYGPGSARTLDDTLPENVQQGEWVCPQQAQVHAFLICAHEHKGPVMALCSWHEEIVEHAEMVAGTTRKVADVVKVRGHYEEIQRRQAGACVRCLYPSVPGGRDFAAEHKQIEAIQGQLAYLNDVGAWYSARAQGLRQRIEDIVATFDEANARGIIHRCPMRLIQVS